MSPDKMRNKKEGGINLKSDTVRISSSKLVGRDHIEGLSGKEVTQIIKTLLKHFPSGYLRNPQELDKTLNDFRFYHEQLHEYKELHNGINEILVAFEPFKVQISYSHSHFKEFRPELRELRILWRPVSMQVDSLIKWSHTIKFIGKPLQEFDDQSKSGEEWAIQFCDLQRRINDHLDLNQYSANWIEAAQKRNIFSFLGQSNETPWWETLFELTSSFNNISSHYMNTTDKKLRQTAQELFNLSSKTLSSY